MTDRMPDFTMPSAEQLAAERLAAERLAEADARARAGDPSTSRGPLGFEPEDIDEASLDGEDGEARGADGADVAEHGPVPAASQPPPPDPADRIHARRADRPTRMPPATRQRMLAVVRNPIVAFATGAVVVAAGFLAAPPLTAWTERGSQAELVRVVDAYAAAISEGDVEAALALHRPDERYGSLAMLEAGVRPSTLPSMSCEPPTSTSAADVAIARCSLTIPGFGGAGSGVQVRVERGDDGWRIASGLEQRTRLLPDFFELVGIEDVPMEGVLDPDVPDYWMLPGQYEIDIRTTELFELTSYGGGGLVVSDGGGYLNAFPQISDIVVRDVEAAALAFAQACVVDAATAAECGMTLPDDGDEVDATYAQSGYSQDMGVMGIPVRITGLGSIIAPNVEVLVRFDETWTSYELEVTGITELYG